MWFGSGKLLSRPDEPPFPHAAAVLRSHRLAQDLMKLRDIHHSVRLLLNLARCVCVCVLVCVRVRACVLCTCVCLSVCVCEQRMYEILVGIRWSCPVV